MAENCEFFLPHPCLTPPFRVIPFEFLDETYGAKTTGMRLLCGENCTILTTTVFARITRVTDRQTDGQTDGRNCDSICALTAYMLSRTKTDIRCYRKEVSSSSSSFSSSSSCYYYYYYCFCYYYYCYFQPCNWSYAFRLLIPLLKPLIAITA